MKAEDPLPLKKSPGQCPAGIILAAGSSTRMGRTKQLLQVGGKKLVARILDETLASDLKKVVLVLGHKGKEIESVLEEYQKHPKLHFVKNPKYKKGISTSIIAGLRAVEDEYDPIMFILADMPYIDKSLINSLLNNYLDSQLSMGAVGVKGRRSHPVIFSRKWYRELHRLKGDKGARELFSKYPEDVHLFEAGEYFRDIDIDTPEDLNKLKKGDYS